MHANNHRGWNQTKLYVDCSHIKGINKYNNAMGNNSIKYIFVRTGQHYDFEMSQVFFEDFELPETDIYLGVGSGTHTEWTPRIMLRLENIFTDRQPELAIVVRDVNSTLAGALTAAKMHIPVAHVEAGLRSYDRDMPEEINRLLSDAISDYLFTHSPDADENRRSCSASPCASEYMRKWSDEGQLEVYRIDPRRDRRFNHEEILGFLSNNGRFWKT